MSVYPMSVQIMDAGQVAANTFMGVPGGYVYDVAAYYPDGSVYSTGTSPEPSQEKAYRAALSIQERLLRKPWNAQDCHRPRTLAEQLGVQLPKR